MLIAEGKEAAAALGIISGVWIFAALMNAVFIGIGITLFVFWIISIVDVSQRKNEEFPNASENSKTTWLIVLLVTLIMPVAAGIAGIVYYANVMKKMPRNKEKTVLPTQDQVPPQS
jgi:heme/copper-type cytochrome/quinol oxidase subunit 3